MFQNLPRSLRLTRVALIVFIGALSSMPSAQSQIVHDHAKAPPAVTMQTLPVEAAVALSSPPTLKFDSTLSRYKAMTDQKLGSWREANDTVTRIGGWRTYLKQAQEPDAKAPISAPAPVAPPVPVAPATHPVHGVKP